MTSMDYNGLVILSAAIFVGLLGIVDCSCTCGIFVLSREKIPVENIARGAPAPWPCNDETAHEQCKNTCLGKLKTMMKDFHVIIQQLELKSVYHICRKSVQDSRSSSSDSRSLYLGGYYKSCEKSWDPVGIELKESVCCKDNAIYSCRTEGYDSRTLLIEGKPVRTKRSTEVELPNTNGEVTNTISESVPSETSSSFLKSNPWKSMARYIRMILPRKWVDNTHNIATKDMFGTLKDSLSKVMNLISVEDEEAIDKQLLTDLPTWLSSFASFYFRYSHELSLGYCYFEFLGSRFIGGRDSYGRAISNDNMASIINFALNMMGGNNSKDFIGFMDNVLPLLGKFSKNEALVHIVSGLMENYFNPKAPPKKAVNLNAIPETTDKLDKEPTKPPTSGIKHNEVITQFLMTVAKDYLSNYFSGGHKKPPEVNAVENKNMTVLKAKQMRQQMYDRTMETVKTVFISVFGMVPGRQPSTQLDAFVSQLMGRTPAHEPLDDNFIDDHSNFYRPPLHKQIDDRYYDVAAQDRDGIFSTLSNFNNPKSSWHCLRNYAVNKMFVLMSTAVRGLLFNGLGKRSDQ